MNTEIADINLGPTTGSVTLPAEAGCEATVRELFDRWGADAIRDSDGTTLSPELVEMGHRIYSTVCLVRAEQEWPRAHPDHLPMKFLMSDPVTASSDRTCIRVLDGFHAEKYSPATQDEATAYWEVIDRTTGEKHDAWELDAETGEVTVLNAVPYHVYTVNFLTYVTWDTTSMYNHMVNNWDRPHVVSTDPYHAEAWDHLMAWYDTWLQEHATTDVVRLTTLAYHFNIDNNEKGDSKFRDWTGCQETVSLPALRDFEEEFGYRPRAEDFVDAGYYNGVERIPSPRYQDWIAFIHRFVVRFGRELRDRAHAAGRQTAMFWGDHWAGVEPYRPDFQDMGIDIHIGACEDGVALRRVSDAPGPQIKELRFYPYFFPDVFREGGDPLGESITNWIKIRRALLRKPVDRIGYGGYLSLAAKFPSFVSQVADLCDEFRALRAVTKGTESAKIPVRVGVLNAWGRSRAWINSFGPAQKFLVKRGDINLVAGSNLLECLAGLPVEVEFLNFDDVRNGGLGEIDVLINDGAAGMSWSGGHHWADPAVTTAVRAFVHRGGGFIGCRGPTAHPHGGRFFQLADVMGVEKESGQSVQGEVFRPDETGSHFITADIGDLCDFGCHENFVYACGPDTRILRQSDGHVMLAVNTVAAGRSVFMAGLPYSLQNARLLYRAILWTGGREDSLQQCFCENQNMDCAWYPEVGALAVVNNVDEPQTTRLFDGDGVEHSVELAPRKLRWYRSGVADA